MRRLLKDDELLSRIDDDWRSAGLTAKRMAMLDYVEKLTVNPWEVSQQDLDALREADFSDRDILDINEVAAYYAYVNRIADGLGVSLESWIPDDS